MLALPPIDVKSWLESARSAWDCGRASYRFPTEAYRIPAAVLAVIMPALEGKKR